MTARSGRGRGLASFARLVFDHAEDYQLVVSPVVLQEVLGVLHRPELARRFSTFPGQDTATVLGFLRAADVVLVDESAIPVISRDRKDGKYPAPPWRGRPRSW
jgi:hypothetical protein